MSEKFKVGILIVLYKSIYHLDLLIKSIKEQTYKNITVYVLDCNDTSNEVSFFISEYPKGIILTGYGNIGFAKANNILAKRAMQDGCEYIFILNPDMELASDTIEKLVSVASSDKLIGVVSALLLFGKEKAKEQRVQLFGGKLNFSTQNKKFLYSNKLLEEIELPKLLTVDFVNGGSMLIKNELIKKIGLFNENYFMYNDETDFAYRVKKAGYKIVVTSETIIWHHHDWSNNNKIGFYIMYYYMMRNRVLFFKENKLYINLFLDIFNQIISLPIKIKWLTRVADIKLVKYYYLGLWRGISGEIGKSNIDFNK